MKPEDFLDCIKEQVGDKLAEYHICIEHHEDGSPHAHCLYKFKTRLQRKGADFFNAYWYHPHIESTRNWSKVKSYIYKGDHGSERPTVLNNTKFDWSSYNGFKRRREDYIQWKRELLLGRRTELIDNICIWNTVIPLNMNTKKRHLWIHGEANCGKTFQVIKQNFERRGVLHYQAGTPTEESKSLYGTFDRYARERYLVWDDNETGLNKGAICQLSNISDDPVGRAPIRGRGQDQVFYKTIIMIVLSNYPPGYHYQQEWEKEDWFQARFYTIKVAQIQGTGEIVTIDGIEREEDIQI